jgi:OOP family OmpA-OmpF porin
VKGATCACVASLLAAAPASAQEKRFDADVFQPSAGPRDLVMVQKSEVIGHLSPVLGLFTQLELNPLAVITNQGNQSLRAITAGLTFTPMAGIGFFNWLDVTAAIPLVAWQTGDNLREIGTEGLVASNAVGDTRLSARVAIPYLDRKDDVKSGFGLAVAGNINLPTGNPAAFTGDGVITGGPVIIADYRFGFGLLVAANTGLWLRPSTDFAGINIGSMASAGVAAEQYVWQSKGVSVIGEVYAYPTLSKFPTSPREVPAEVLLGVRWQGKRGVTVTAGGSFGAACGFGAPSLALWASVTWQPANSREQEEIDRLQQRDEDDPDHDGLIGDTDRCPNAAGPPENHGCPDSDTDGDGVVDRLDECPDLPAGPHGRNGCPPAYIQDDMIVTLDQVHFATDKDVILDESKPTLDEVVKVLIEHPEIREVHIDGHTDVRASDAYNLLLSQRRVNSVMHYLTQQGIDSQRLQAKGSGHTQPVDDDRACLDPDEALSPTCRMMTAKNRRVVFRIVRRGAPPPRPITGADGNSSLLPTKETVLPTDATVLPKAESGAGVLKWQGPLPTSKGTLPSTVLPEAGANHGLPQQTKALPDKGVLPRQGTPSKPEEAKPEPPSSAGAKPKPPPSPPPLPPPSAASSAKPPPAQD